MPHTSPEPTTDRRLAIAVRGVVQGVGFRPFVGNAARTRGLAGWVRNEADMVRIEVQGDGEAVEGSLEALRSEAPPQASVEAIEIQVLDCLDDVSEAGAMESMKEEPC